MAALRILALVLMVIVLVPSAAHLFELPGKIGLDRDAYFTVQGIYAGWSLFAIPIFAAIIVNFALFVMERRRRASGGLWALAGALLLVVSLGVFFTFVFPGNQQTVNWTVQHEDWEALRHNWEYGHAANAIIVFAAFLATAASVVRRD